MMSFTIITAVCGAVVIGSYDDRYHSRRYVTSGRCRGFDHFSSAEKNKTHQNGCSHLIRVVAHMSNTRLTYCTIRFYSSTCPSHNGAIRRAKWASAPRNKPLGKFNPYKCQRSNVFLTSPVRGGRRGQGKLVLVNNFPY